MSRWNGMKKSGAKLQSTSEENWSIQVSVPTPTLTSEPSNVSVPCPTSRPVLQLIRLVKSATATPSRSPLYTLINPVVSQRNMKPDEPTGTHVVEPKTETTYVPET